MSVLLDTGPWVALLSRNDTHHRWAVEQFRLLPPPLPTCEAVVTETCFLLKRSGFDPSLALQFIERGVVQLPFVLQEQNSNSWMARMSWACSRKWVANECRLL